MADLSLVQTVCDFTGLVPELDRDLILSALRAKNNNHEAVVAEFYEDEGKFRQAYTWSEMPFFADRDGNFDSANVPSFSIQGADEGPVIQGVPPTNSVPPSRPPSRTNNRSPLGRMVEWTAGDTTGVPNSRAQEEADLQRALAESAADSGLQAPPPQEEGVTSQGDVHLPFFGPAVREHYEQSQWAVVPINRDKPDPLPSERKRQPEAPAFLRCRGAPQERHRIGALLTIFHEIPAARNILLEVGKPAATYGINNQWWKGEAILPADALLPAEDGQNQWAAQPEPDFAEEVHRLVAFLDLTDRSYGTADVLAGLSSISGTWAPELREANFFETLKKAVKDSSDQQDISTDQLETLEDLGPVAPFFSGVQILPFFPSAYMQGPVEIERFGLLDIRLSKESYEAMENLYDAWDDLFWMDAKTLSEDQDLRTAVIPEVGDVLTMLIGGEGLVHPIEIPEVFYLDRYFASEAEETIEQQVTLRSLRRTLANSFRLESSSQMWDNPQTGLRFDRRAMSRSLIEKKKKTDRQIRDAALWRRHQELKDTDDYFPYLPGFMDHMMVLTAEEEAALQKLADEIRWHEQEIQAIDIKVEEARSFQTKLKAQIREMSSRRTVPSPTDGWKPTLRYTLKGVATSHNTVYVARRAEPDLKDMDGEATAVDQWWRLSYVAGEDHPLSVTTTTIQEVTHAACTETNTPILIYANDHAMHAIPRELTDALRTFIKFDNRYFRQELIEQTPEEPSHPPPQKPLPQPPPYQMPSYQPQAEQQTRQQDDSMVSFSSDPVTGVRTFSSEVHPGSRGSSMSDQQMDEGTEMAEIVLMDASNRTPSSTASTATIHTPSTMMDTDGGAAEQQQQQQEQQQVDDQKAAEVPSMLHSI